MFPLQGSSSIYLIKPNKVVFVVKMSYEWNRQNFNFKKIKRLEEEKTGQFQAEIRYIAEEKKLLTIK